MRYQLLALSLIAISGCEKPPAKPTPPHEVVITQAITCNAPIYRDYVGNVVAKTSVQVMSQATGIMTGQYFVEGQEVKKGDLTYLLSIPVLMRPPSQKQKEPSRKPMPV